jgi:SAM-dependent methyltransferase
MMLNFKRIKESASAFLNIWRHHTAPQTSGAVNVGAEEAALARAYLSTVVENPEDFVDRVSIEDEIYIFVRNNIPQKQYALYRYMYEGREAVQVIDNIVQAVGKRLGDLRSFLDFACGYGKSTRFLVQSLAPQKVWVSDIYTGAVDFQKAHLRVNGFYSATNPGDVKFPRKYEVIYVGSLFSHLPAPQFKAWLARLYEVLADDGLLVFSTHGESVYPLEGEAVTTGFMFIPESESRSLDKQQYGSMTVTEKWVRGLASELGVAQVHYLKRELWAQDVFVVTKARMPLLDGLKPNPFPRGHIDTAIVDAEGQLHVSGWAMDRRYGAPVKAVRIEVDEAHLVPADLDLSRPDVAAHFNRSDSERAGWCYVGSVEGLAAPSPSGSSTDPPLIKVLIEGRDDAVTCLVASVDRKLATAV